MTIDETIVDLSIQREVKRQLGKDYQANSLNIGIEALERLQVGRNNPGSQWNVMLPSETED